MKKEYIDLIAYKKDGTIYTKPRNEQVEKDINEVLGLNGSSGKDTLTEIVKGRRDAYGRAESLVSLLRKKGKCSSHNISRKIEDSINKAEYDEYIGVTLFYLNRVKNKLEKQGR